MINGTNTVGKNSIDKKMLTLNITLQIFMMLNLIKMVLSAAHH